MWGCLLPLVDMLRSLGLSAATVLGPCGQTKSEESRAPRKNREERISVGCVERDLRYQCIK